MKIEFKDLEKLLSCNTQIKLNLIDNSNMLEVKYNYKVIAMLELKNNNIMDNSQIIYDKITNLENITLYIPKIHIKD